MKLISWNVNGLRACLQKGFMDFFREQAADAYCLQETKMQQGQAEIDIKGYAEYWNSAEKKGYSGTAIFTRQEPIAATNGIGVPEHDTEGRVITLEYEKYYLVTVYTPNSQRELTRLDYRMAWEEAFLGYIKALDKKKPVIVCGDMNVAHKEIDLKHPKSNANNAGFTQKERSRMTLALDSGFSDSYRLLHPDETNCYTWWSYIGNARAKNTGWRIDYFLVSDRIKDRIVSADIHQSVMGSDHCPVSLEIDI